VRTVYSCLADPQQGAAVLRQLHVWTTTLQQLAHVARADLFVHVVARAESAEIVGWLAARGITHALVPPFGDGKYCNKLRQLDTPALRAFDRVVLCDTDLAFGAPFVPTLAPDRIAAKVVDGERPSLAVLDAVFDAAGFDARPARQRCGFADAPTYAGNCNGGLYVIPSVLLAPLGARWQHWALWLHERSELLGRYHAHVDQVSFALAAFDLDLAVTPLPAAYNFPTHLPAERYDPSAPEPIVLHYHRHVEPDGRLMACACALANACVERVNAAAYPIATGV
jgi:hypothetical protein